MLDVNCTAPRAEIERSAQTREALERNRSMANPDELKMDESERLWWERVRARGALFYVVTKGLFFLIAYPSLGCYVFDWGWEPMLLVEGWVIGLFWGSCLYIRKELRFRFTLEYEGLPLPDGWGD